MREFNIILAGVGGQGTLLAGEAIGTAAVMEGLNVRVSEIHGMAQRGGSVVSNVRIGDAVFSPTVTEGRAHVILGFEPLETLRGLKFASDKTVIVMNAKPVPPPELATSSAKYPKADEILAKIHAFTRNVIVVDAADLAAKAGNRLAQNSVLLGALAGLESFPLRAESLVEALKGLVPKGYVEVNLKAFELGRLSVGKAKKRV